MLSSLLAYEYDLGFHLPYVVMRYISSVTSNVSSDGLDDEKNDNKPLRNNVMLRS